MTGNTSKWRAPLAGLASVAMLATMGLVAGTANAAVQTKFGEPAGNGFAVKVYLADKPYEAIKNAGGSDKYVQVNRYGARLDLQDVTDQLEPYAATDDHKILNGYSYNLKGDSIAVSDVAIKGDTKLFAQYAKAVQVTFHFTDGTSKSTEVKAGEGLTANDVTTDAENAAQRWANTNHKTFVGWSTVNGNGANATVNRDLYEGDPLTADTDLYPVYEDAWQNGSKWESTDSTTPNDNIVGVKLIDANTGNPTLHFTLNGHPFPAFRVPTDWTYSFSWKLPWTRGFKDVAEWQKEGTDSEYNFSSVVPQTEDVVDLTLVGVHNASDNAYTVNYDFDGNSKWQVQTLLDDVDNQRPEVQTYVSGDSDVVLPTPAAVGAQFLGWKANGEYVKAGTRVADLAKSGRTVELTADYDTDNIAEVQYLSEYKDGWLARHFEYVTKGSKLPQPENLEDYYQTAADKDPANPTWSTSKITSWVNTASGVTIDKVTTSTSTSKVEVKANWSSSVSLKLDANGGLFKSGSNYAWATKADGQKWADVIETPTRAGYTFAYWYAPVFQGYKNVVFNTYDGNFYNYATGTPVKLWSFDDVIKSGVAVPELLAFWSNDGQDAVAANLYKYGLSFRNQQEDVAKLVKDGYTQASATVFVKNFYGLYDQYVAYTQLEGQARVDAAAKLNAAIESASKDLVRTDDTEVPSGKVAVYRLYNPNAKNAGAHHYTTSQKEYDALQLKGWKGEGVFFLTTTSKDATPLYRLYNKHNGAHHYTADLNEKNSLVKKGWTYENIGWYVDAKAPVAVYRAYNPNTGEHVYTADENEYKGLTENHGWDAEKVAFQAWKAE